MVQTKVPLILSKKTLPNDGHRIHTLHSQLPALVQRNIRKAYASIASLIALRPDDWLSSFFKLLDYRIDRHDFHILSPKITRIYLQIQWAHSPTAWSTRAACCTFYFWAEQGGKMQPYKTRRSLSHPTSTKNKKKWNEWQKNHTKQMMQKLLLQWIFFNNTVHLPFPTKSMKNLHHPTPSRHHLTSYLVPLWRWMRWRRRNRFVVLLAAFKGRFVCQLIWSRNLWKKKTVSMEVKHF